MLPRLNASRATAEASTTNAALFNNGTNSSYSNLGDIIGQPVPSAITRIWFTISALTSERKLRASPQIWPGQAARFEYRQR